MNLARSGTKIFLASVGVNVAGFVGIAYFARVLGTQDLGVFFLFQALVGMLVIVSDLGIRTAVEKRMSGSASRPETLSNALVLYALIFTPVALAILVFSPWIDQYVGADVSILLVVVIALSLLKHLTKATLSGELRVGENAVLNFTDKAVWVVVGVVFVSFGFGSMGLIYGFVTGVATSFLWGAWKIDTSPGYPRLESTLSLLQFAKYNFIPSLGGQVHSWMDVLIIGYFLSQADVGAYEIAWQVAGITTILAGAIGSVMLPQASSWDANDERWRIGETLSRAIPLAVFLIVPSFFGVLVLAPELLTVLFGAEFAVAWVALIILVGGKVSGAIQSIVGRCLLAIDKPGLVARATVYMICANLSLNLVLITTFGLVGAAVGTTLAYTLGLLFRIKYLSAFVEITVPYRELGWILLSSIVMFGVLSAISFWVAIDSFSKLFTVIGIGIISYLAVMGASRTFRSRVHTYKNAIRAE